MKQHSVGLLGMVCNFEIEKNKIDQNFVLMLSKQILTYSGHKGIVEFLLKNGANKNGKNTSGQTASDLAVQRGKVKSQNNVSRFHLLFFVR